MKRILLGLAVAFLLCSGMAMAAGTPAAAPTCPVTSEVSTVPGALAPVLVSGCTETVICPGSGNHLSCSSRFPDECGPLFTCDTFTECGVSCFPVGNKFCPGYTISNCAC
jgi:hypothetical protein